MNGRNCLGLKRFPPSLTGKLSSVSGWTPQSGVATTATLDIAAPLTNLWFLQIGPLTVSHETVNAWRHTQRFLPATEFGRGIISEDDDCDVYEMCPSGTAEVAPGCCCLCWGSLLAGVSAGDAVPLPDSSSATGEQVSARALCARPWHPPPLKLPSLLHSRLEPLRSSFSEELVMVAKREETEEKKQRGRQIKPKVSPAAKNRNLFLMFICFSVDVHRVPMLHSVWVETKLIRERTTKEHWEVSEKYRCFNTPHTPPHKHTQTNKSYKTRGQWTTNLIWNDESNAS